MKDNVNSQWKKSEIYSFTDEKVPLDADFPVFMFSFSVAKDPIRNLHRHDVLELGVCIKGNGIFILDNSIQTYEAGDVIVIGKGVYHRAKSGTGMEDLWYFLYLNPADWSAPDLPSNIARLVTFRDDPKLCILINLITDEIRNLQDDYKTSIKGLINTVMVRISRLEQISEKEKRAVSSSPGVVDKRINNAIDILLNAEKKVHSIRELADKCNLSESHFRHLFTEQVGVSPKHFQLKLQIKTAMVMLKEKNMRVVDISEDCGFDSLSSFNRHFKDETGVSPLQWRAHQAKSK